jgi:hypothetical protein
MVDNPEGLYQLFDDYVQDSFTLAVSRYLVGELKGAVKATIQSTHDDSLPAQNPMQPGEKRFSLVELSRPGVPEFVLAGKQAEWMRAGMMLTYREYDKLREAISKMESLPIVILLYNPAAYEIYRATRVDPNEETDRASEFQRQALRAYAHQKGWRFVDMTESLQDEVNRTGSWIYGQYDRVHWSEEGTKVVASVLAKKLMQVTGTCTLKSRSDTVMSSIC